jgi:hypothetical protein
LSVDGRVWVGDEAAAGRAHVFLVDSFNPAAVLWSGGADEGGRYFITAGEEGGEAPGEVCAGSVLVTLDNGIESEPVRLFDDPPVPCRGVFPPFSAPEFFFPADMPPLIVYGLVRSESPGLLEFFVDAHSAAPTHTSIFGWSVPPWVFVEADTTVTSQSYMSSPNYATSLGLWPGDDVPPEVCDYFVRSVLDDGSTSELTPLFKDRPAVCLGKLEGRTIVWSQVPAP